MEDEENNLGYGHLIGKRVKIFYKSVLENETGILTLETNTTIVIGSTTIPKSMIAAVENLEWRR